MFDGAFITVCGLCSVCSVQWCKDVVLYTCTVPSCFRFDMLVNGGGSVTLRFFRNPFETKDTTVMVPWNRMITMETVTLTLKDQQLPVEDTCPGVSHDHYVVRPIVLSTWQHTQLGACPSKSTIIPESHKYYKRAFTYLGRTCTWCITVVKARATCRPSWFSWPLIPYQKTW